MKKTLFLLAFATVLSSCATTFRGSRQTVTVSAEPPGSEIQIDMGNPQLDQARVRLSRRKDHLVVVSKEGCKTETRQIVSSGSPGWIVADALGFFVFGIGIPVMIVDAATGSLKELSPDKMHVILDCDEK